MSVCNYQVYSLYVGKETAILGIYAELGDQQHLRFVEKHNEILQTRASFSGLEMMRIV